jgi:type 1 glutamine amidotransferase
VRGFRAILGLAGAVALAACGAGAAAVASQAGRPALRILVLTQTRGYRHGSIPAALNMLRGLSGSGGRRYEIVSLPSAAALDARALRGASAVVFLLTSGELPMRASGQRALVTYVRSGGALVGFHSATDTFHHWAAYLRMIGGEFSHHPLPSTQRMVVEDRGNAATRSLPASFRIKEEFYVFKHEPRAGAHVLMRLDTGAGGPDQPLVWCRRFGLGRVFYDALGHFPQTWQDPRQVALVSGGLAWAVHLGPSGGC